MCREVTIDYFHDVHSACFADWFIGLCTYQPVVMSSADQKYKDFLFYCVSAGIIDQHHYDIYLNNWSEECRQKLEEFNNGK